MKTTIEMHGYEITIEEREEGLLVVSASKDGEVVEEFELEGGEDHPGHESEEDGEDMEAFGEEESDLGDDEEMGEEESGEEEEEEEEEEAPAEEGALESFSAYFNKNKKVKRVNESRKVSPKRSRR
jgi:hypothetical protein